MQQAPEPPAQPSLVPLASGHAAVAGAPAPFSASAPESTFSLAQVRTLAEAPAVDVEVPSELAQPLWSSPPSYRDIRAGRAAAATRAPVAEVRIPVAELDAAVLSLGQAGTMASMAPLSGMDALVERVRQRTAARVSRAATASAR